MNRFQTALIAFSITLLSGLVSEAGEIKLIGSTGVRGVVSELSKQFEVKTGARVVTEFDVFAVLKRKIDAGERFDVAILSPGLVDELIKAGKIVEQTRAMIGRTGIGVAVLKGASKPDIGSVEALKTALLQAKSVGYPREGASGVHFLSTLDRLGIAPEMKSKLRPFEGGGPPLQSFAAGEPELVVGGTTLFPAIPEAEFVGPFPPELQAYILFTAGVSAAAENREAASAFVRFLTGPEGVATIKAKGMEPSPSTP